MQTFWALTVIPKDQQKGSHNKSRLDKTTTHSLPEMLKPMYETEHSVTAAIATGTKQVDPNYPTDDPYVVAKKWQKYLKALESLKFRFKKNTATANRNGNYNHRMQF